jgi:hypothetical protein
VTESQAKLLESSHFLRPIYLTGRIELGGKRYKTGNPI